MKIVGISDIHGHLIEPSSFNNGEHFDVLCICGDLIPLEVQSNDEESHIWFTTDFIEWCNKIDCDRIIFIAGNHDRYLEKLLIKNNYDPEAVSKILGWYKNDKLKFLHDSLYEFKGKTFYGTPWCPNLYRWSFYGDPQQLYKHFSKIPDCNVLISHSPGRRMFETGTILQSFNKDEVGSIELTEAVMSRKIDLWLCGHIHSGNHDLNIFYDRDYRCDGMKVVNVSTVNERYDPVFKPFIIEI